MTFSKRKKKYYLHSNIRCLLNSSQDSFHNNTISLFWLCFLLRWFDHIFNSTEGKIKNEYDLPAVCLTLMTNIEIKSKIIN